MKKDRKKERKKWREMKHQGRERGVGGDSGSSSVAEEKGRKRSGGNKTDERGRERKHSNSQVKNEIVEALL